MIAQLISITSTREYKECGNIYLQALKGNFADTEEIKYEFRIEIQGELGDLHKQLWEIKAIKVVDSHLPFLSVSLRPYNVIRVYERHPLLWRFQSEELIIKVSGNSIDLNSFMGDLWIETEKLGGNWIDFHWYFFPLPLRLPKDGFAIISILEPMSKIFFNVCNKYGLICKVEEKSQPPETYRNSKLLIFSNEIVSPDDFNLRQPYIVADSFYERRIE